MAVCPLEVRSAASAWDSAGRLHHWVSVQAPHAVKMGLQTIFGLDPDDGAGHRAGCRWRFGPKFSNYPEDVVTAWVARRLERPARWTETRTESMMAMHHGRGQRHRVTLGGTREGTLLAYLARDRTGRGCLRQPRCVCARSHGAHDDGCLRHRTYAATALAPIFRDDPGVRLPGEWTSRGDRSHRAGRRCLRAGRSIWIPIELRRRNLVDRDVVSVHDSGRHRLRHRRLSARRWTSWCVSRVTTRCAESNNASVTPAIAVAWVSVQRSTSNRRPRARRWSSARSPSTVIVVGPSCVPGRHRTGRATSPRGR